MATSFTKRLISACLFILFIGEIVFITPAGAATTMNLPIEDFFSVDMVIEEGAHLYCEDLDVDVQIPSNTMVTLSTENKLSSKNAIAGSEVALRVAYDVVIEGTVVIPAGAMATGRVLEAKKAKIFGKPGYLSIGVESISVDGRSIPVSGPEMSDKGESKSAISWVCFGISFIILWPLLFVPFCIKGQEAEIPAGTKLTAYTSYQADQHDSALPAGTN